MKRKQLKNYQIKNNKNKSHLTLYNQMKIKRENLKKKDLQY